MMNFDPSNYPKIMFLLLFGLMTSYGCNQKPESADQGNSPNPNLGVAVRLTFPDQSHLYAAGDESTISDANFDLPTITIDTAQAFQEMDGFGYTLTGGSAMLMMTKLSDEQRRNILNELFRWDKDNIGVSYLRISIGASDLDSKVFSYLDTENGVPDTALNRFSLAPDEDYLIPILKEIIFINPDIKIMATPWSAPLWMKTNGSAKGGKLKTEFYDAYARYLSLYITQMNDLGINIDAITIQNEPENPDNTPSMVMTAQEQNTFIKHQLGPVFSQANIKTKIILFDHNCDHPDYPISILNDTTTRKFVDGSAFHMYAGEISALSTVKAAHPDKNVYFTEQWTSGEGNFGGDLSWHLHNIIIGAPRNWSKNVLEWNLASDEQFGPHTDGGCTMCQGAITINSTNGQIDRNVSYYIIAHASQLVRPGSVRIFSNELEGIYNVAFLTPDGKKVVIALNDRKDATSFTITDKKLSFTSTLPSGGVGTYSW